jgi:hypothetical protein
MRTFDQSRGLELIRQDYREDLVFRFLRDGRQVARFSGRSESRELTEVEKQEHPGFDKAITWHVESRGGQILDPERSETNILDEVIIEALTAFQGFYGSAGFRGGRYIHAVVEVRLPECPLPDLGPRQLSPSGAALAAMRRHPFVAFVLFAAVSWLLWTFLLQPLISQ